MAEVFPRITIEPGKCGGKPCIRGYRLTVEHVLALLAEGSTHEDLLREWTFLEEDDIRAALRYGAWMSGGDGPLAKAS
jgi:uncharacterized protein (DUF433 family)